MKKLIKELTVPMTLAPELAEKFRTRDPRTHQAIADPSLDSFGKALAGAQDKAKQIIAMAKALSEDRSVTQEAAMLRLRAAALKLGEAAGAALDAARARIDTELAGIASATNAPAPAKDTTGGFLIEGEVRAALRSMSSKDRGEAISKALADGDDLIIGAVIRGPAMLSGHSAAEFALHRATWRRQAFPAEVEREARLTAARDAADRAGKALVAFIEEAAGGEMAARLEAASKKAAEQLAAAE